MATFKCAMFSRIIASGASGAQAHNSKAEISNADKIRALVPLVANETLFVVVGQIGGPFSVSSLRFCVRSLENFEGKDENIICGEV